MKRLTGFLVRNWPLKMGAILLASVLYSGLVLGQNVRTWTGTITVTPVRPPNGAVLSDLDPVTTVRYRAPLDIGVISPTSFDATADLSGIEVAAGGPLQVVPVRLIALDSRIQIVDYQPQQVEVQLDPVTAKTLPVTVDVGVVPGGLNHSPPQTDPSTVTIRGASSRVDEVSAVVVRVPIDASALNIDRSFELVPLNSAGNEVPNVTLDPERTRVRIAVARELANRTLPLVPQVVGQPATGYQITSVTVEPLVITVSGEEATITQLETATTEPIDINGRTDDLHAIVRLALPAGVSVSGDDTVRVMIVIEPQTGARTFFAPVTLSGARPGFGYAVDVTQIQVIATGPLAALDAIDPASVVATIEVAGLEPGSHSVEWSVSDAPPEVDYSFSAEPRLVTVTGPPPSPTVAAMPVASASLVATS